MSVSKIISNISSGKIDEQYIQSFKLNPSHIQQNVLQLLGEKKIKNGAPIVLNAIESNDKNILRTAIWSVGRLQIEIASKKLQKIFSEKKDEKIRRTIIWTLSKIKGADNLAFFFKLLKNTNVSLKKSLSLAFVEYGEKSIQGLIELLKDKNPEITQRVIEILPKIPGIEVKIVSLLQDNDKQLRRTAVYVLGKTAQESSIDYLIKALKDEDIGVQKRAIKALGLLKKEKATSFLIEFLRNKNIDLQREAIKALGSIGGEEALKSLTGLRKKVFLENYNLLNKSLLSLGYNSRSEINNKILNKLEDEFDTKHFFYLAEVPEGLEKIALADIKNRYFIDLIEIAPGKIVFGYKGDIKNLREIRSVKEIYLFLTSFRKEKEEFSKKLDKINLSSLFSLFGKEKNFSFFLNLRELKDFTQQSELSLALKQWLSKKTLWTSLSQGYNVEFKIFPVGKNLFLVLKLVDFLNFTREWRKFLMPASLDPTLAYLMCILSGVSKNDIFLDPTCGSGTIVIERSFAGPCDRIIGSDIDKKVIEHAKKNIKLANKKIEIYNWDAKNIPLEKKSVTKIVANLPYGRRIGSHRSNLELYSLFIKELNRIMKEDGRAVLLTQEKNLLIDSVRKEKELLIKETITVKIGGIQPDIFILEKIN